MNSTRLRMALVMLGAVAGGVGGCGYKIGSMHRSDVKSIYVPVWTRGRNVYRRDVEKHLTEAIIKRIQTDTQYRISTQAAADTKLTGTIERIRQDVLTINTDTDEARELEVEFTVSFVWTDLRKAKEQRWDKFRAVGRYIRSAPFSETFAVGGEDAINEVAQRIVEQLEEKW